MQKELEKLRDILDRSDNIVFFGGAGVSTESGIPDFRSADGLYRGKHDYPPEVILSHTFFISQPQYFYEFYRSKMLYLDAEPGEAHRALSELEKRGRLKAVITQNIDALHQKAGSENVLELHGSVYRNYCMKCGMFHGVEAISESSGIPLCGCGGIIKPDVVLYEESLKNEVMESAARHLSEADTLIVGGTSLSVYPAAGLVDFYQGDRLVLINQSETPMDGRANLIIRGSIGRALKGALQ